MIEELIHKNRSYRRFHEEVSIELNTLMELVDFARLSPSGANMQPLKYLLSSEPKRNALIFPQLMWAGYLKGWPGPPEGERPSAYIIIVLDKTIKQSVGCDHGIAAQSILLGAVEKGFGGCIIASVNREKLAQTLKLDPRYEILLVIALGKPKEIVKLEKMAANGDIKYWRDTQGVHHVPKRSLTEIIIDS